MKLLTFEDQGVHKLGVKTEQGLLLMFPLPQRMGLMLMSKQILCLL